MKGKVAKKLWSGIDTIRADKPKLIAVCAVIIAQILHLFGFGWFLVPSLAFALVVALPMPAVFSSIFARLIFASLLVFSLLQVSIAIQFFVFPESGFNTLGLLTSAIVLAMVFLCASRDKQWNGYFSKTDLGAVVTASLFAVPFALFCFLGSGAQQIAKFGGLQSPDGSAHSGMIGGLAGGQHLDYRTYYKYYPKGFHLSEAFVLDTVSANIRQNSWLTNAYVFVSQYLVWGSLLAMVLYYFARQLGTTVFGQPKKSTGALLLAVMLGAPLSLFYIIPFTHQGFLNYYYVCAAIVAALALLVGFKLENKRDTWFVVSYFALTFGVGMSWGPLLLPILLAAPVIYVALNHGSLRRLAGRLKANWRRYALVAAGIALALVPVGIHLAHSSSANFNDSGSITVLNLGLLLLGIVVTIFFAVTKQVSDQGRSLMIGALTPFWLLVGGLVFVQYLVVGEPRYYSIKASYLLEMMLLAITVAVLVFIVLRNYSNKLQAWITLPLLLGIGWFLLIAVNANPLENIRKMLIGSPYFEQDVAKMTDLGVKGELRAYNNLVIHYNPAENKITGAPLLHSWANSITPINEGNPVSSKCGGNIFSILAYGSGSTAEQEELIKQIKICVNDRTVTHGKPYYIVTDPDSVPYLRAIIGDKPTFL